MRHASMISPMTLATALLLFVGASISAAIFLSLGLPPVAYLATDATAWLLIRLAKRRPYARSDSLSSGTAHGASADRLTSSMTQL